LAIMIKVLLLALMFLAAVTSKVEDTSNSAEGQVSSNTKVVDGDTDTVGRRLLLNEEEPDVDNAISEERRRLSGCRDNSNGHCDSFGDCCPEYNNHKYWCGNYDTATFKSNQMCCACGGGINKGKARVQLKTTNSFVKIFDDDGTGAARDGSLWKPNKNKPWFGAVASHSYSTASHMEGVYAESNAFGMLKEPAYWQQIWNDRGSGACNDRSLWKAIPHDGYICLGHVGIGHGGCGTGRHFSNGHTVKNHHFPNYRCVKKEYVVRIHTEDLHRVWYDSGSGANDDASLWNYLSPNGYRLAFANRSHNRPSGPFYDFMPTLF
jgi:hypothetical protein